MISSIQDVIEELQKDMEDRVTEINLLNEDILVNGDLIQKNKDQIEAKFELNSGLIKTIKDKIEVNSGLLKIAIPFSKGSELKTLKIS